MWLDLRWKGKNPLSVLGKLCAKAILRFRHSLGSPVLKSIRVGLGDSGKSASASVGTLENLNAPQEDMPWAEDFLHVISIVNAHWRFSPVHFNAFYFFFPFLAVPSVVKPEHFWQLPSQRLPSASWGGSVEHWGWGVLGTASGLPDLTGLEEVGDDWKSSWHNIEFLITFPNPTSCRFLKRKLLLGENCNQLLQQNEIRIVKVNPVPRAVL